MDVDAIVNTANPKPRFGCGTDFAIYKKAGNELIHLREDIGFIESGHSILTKSVKLKSKYIIHSVATMWIDGNHSEKEILNSSYTSALELAIANNCHSIAFPLMGSGYYSFPKKEALKVAVSSCTDFLIDHNDYSLDIYLVLFDLESVHLGQLISKVPTLVDNIYVQQQGHIEYHSCPETYSDFLESSHSRSLKSDSSKASCFNFPNTNYSTENIQGYETFQQALKHFLDSKGLKSSDLYRRTNQKFNKSSYSRYITHGTHPEMKSVIQIAFALQLNYIELQYFLKTAGYALNRANREDQIIAYYFEKGIYDCMAFDDELYHTLGKTYFSD